MENTGNWAGTVAGPGTGTGPTTMVVGTSNLAAGKIFATAGAGGEAAGITPGTTMDHSGSMVMARSSPMPHTGTGTGPEAGGGFRPTAGTGYLVAVGTTSGGGPEYIGIGHMRVAHGNIITLGGVDIGPLLARPGSSVTA